MAGVEFIKFGGSAMGEMSCHFDNEIRAKITHSNESINQDLTHLNYYLDANSYQEICDSIDHLISDVDAKNPPKRLRKDRKVSFCLEVSCPPELADTDQEDAFFEKVYDMYKTMLPGIKGAVVHKDERHEYYDRTKDAICISRDHMHIFGACLTLDGRINSHDLITREMCQKVNDDIQALCLNEWGISYQTGEGRRGKKKTVEELKQEGYTALQQKLAKENLEVVMQMRREKKTLTTQIEELEVIKDMDVRQAKELDEQVSSKQAYLEDLSEQIEQRSEDLEHIEDDIAQTKRLIEKFNDALANLFTRFNQAYQRLQQIYSHWLANDLNIYKRLVEKTDPAIEQGKMAFTTIMMYNQKIVCCNEHINKKMEEDLDKATEELKEATEKLEAIEEDDEFEI